MLAKGAGCPLSALILSAVLSTLPAVLPAEDAAESTRRCAPRMESAAESTTCSASHEPYVQKRRDRNPFQGHQQHHTAFLTAGVLIG